MNYWLMKSEPSVYSIDDLKKAPKQTDYWDGVRNYQARNMLRDQMKKGDLAFFYHSSCPEPGIAGIVTIVKEGYPDMTAFNPESKYYDPKSAPENPRWFCVDVKFKRKFSSVITLPALRNNPGLRDMVLLRKGNRLSVMPISEKQWQTVLKMAIRA